MGDIKKGRWGMKITTENFKINMICFLIGCAVGALCFNFGLYACRVEAKDSWFATISTEPPINNEIIVRLDEPCVECQRVGGECVINGQDIADIRISCDKGEYLNEKGDK